MSHPATKRAKDHLHLILASSSDGRKMLLSRLIDTFETVAADLVEDAETAASPAALAERLAAMKAEAVLSATQPLGYRVIIGADQVATTGADIIGKPGNAEANCSQLAALSSKRVTFHSAVHLIDSRSARVIAFRDETLVRFRTLSETEIERYVAADQPWHCAGGFKVESRGIALFEAVESKDPTGLIGLPLIRTAEALRQFGVL